MEGKLAKTFALVIPLFAVFNSMLLNLTPFFAGGEANITNLFVTISYLILWFVAIYLAFKIKSKFFLYFYSGFWLVSLSLALVLVYVNVTHAIADWAILMSIVFLTPLFGIGNLVETSLMIASISAIISLLMMIINFTIARKLGRKNAENI